jgi:hypothetical protein
MKSSILVGGMLMAAGFYAWSYGFFHKQTVSPALGYRKFVWLCILMILLGLFVVLI